MDEAMRRAISRRIDDALLTAIHGTACVAPRPEPEPFTLAKLQKLMAAMPPRETWLSSKLFPSDSAITVSGPGENFMCAHPGFWLRLQDHVRKSEGFKAPSVTSNRIGFNFAPTEIDLDENDTPDRAEWKRRHWDRLREAFEVAMQPLPEWLRSPPKFGKHG